MKEQESQLDRANPPLPARGLDAREWWLWIFAVAVTLLLVAGIVALTFPGLYLGTGTDWFDLKTAVRGLAGLVLLFDIYTLFQHYQLQCIRRKLAERDHLFQLITENAADLIAVVDTEGHRLYNSPAYRTVLGYTAEDLQKPSLEQVHPDDRQRVAEAAQKAKLTGRGERLEYRIRHKDGTWRVLESTASVVRDERGAINSLVIVNRDITQRKRAEEMLAHSAFHDGLTKLPNRALFTDRLRHALTLAKRHSNYRFAVLFIDVDEFKVINESLGHSLGDELLVQIGLRLTASLRGMDTISRPVQIERPDQPSSDDTLARLGGDEFTVLLDDIKDPSDAIRVAQRIQEKWAAPFTIGGQEVVVSVSVGIALSSPTYVAAEDLLRDSEIAMYRAKQAGRARCELFDPAMHAAAVKRLHLETDIRKAIELNQFRVFYQPVVALQSGRIVGFEALSRWQRPAGIVPPLEFIQVADETGLIIPINRHLIEEASSQLHAWQQQFPFEPPLSMSVNVTSKQFASPDLPKEIGEILQKANVAPRDFHLEITETITMNDPAYADAMLAKFRVLGTPVSIDDFGTGYSSLSRLQGFPVDALKIDRAFICKMNTDPESREIVRTIIMLAHNLGMKVIAEGAETEEHVRELKALGCELAQGYYFSRPVDAESIVRLLGHFKWNPRAAAAAAP